MMVDPCFRLALGALLLGSLACATSSDDLIELHTRRNAELDRLGQQPGMPDTWGTQAPQDPLPYAPLAADDQ